MDPETRDTLQNDGMQWISLDISECDLGRMYDVYAPEAPLEDGPAFLNLDVDQTARQTPRSRRCAGLPAVFCSA